MNMDAPMPSTPVMNALKAEHDRLAECRDELLDSLRKVEEKIRVVKHAAAILSGERVPVSGGTRRKHNEWTPEKLAAADAVLRRGGTHREAAIAAGMSVGAVNNLLRKGQLYWKRYTVAERSERANAIRYAAKATTP
jgi:hypothetical protein